MTIINFLKLIRYYNLILIAITQFFIQFYILEEFNLEDINFFLLIAITLLITASGYIINDIFDEKIDNVNRKEKV